MSLTMGKIMKKQPPKKYGISSRRFRKIVQERLLNDCNLVQSQHSSSTPLETSIGEVSNISSLLPNVELPTFIDSEPPSKLCNVNIDLNLCSSSFSDNNEISNAPCIENEPCEMESNVSDKFVLDFDSDNNYNFDSDSEITCNEDTRKTDSDLGEDDLELSDFLYRDETPVKENTFSAKLREWALKFHITLIALSALLLLLRVFDSSLPVDARTLLGTLRKTECAEMSDGVYHHFGLERAVENILIERRNKGVQDQKVKLMINVDGVPISNSGKNTFWLILCSEVNSEIVYPVGAFYGTKKPIDANEFLNSFVQEAINVCEKGVKNHNVTIEAIICDAPAKSFILYLKGHTGYDCCPKCLITGVCHRPPPSTRGKKKKGKVCFPGIGPFALKTDQDFKRNKYNSFETDVEIVLTKLPGFGCISCIPLDYMHLVLLGVTKKLISLWVLRKSKVKISSDALNTISNRLLLLRNTIPVEFNRRPRTLWEYKFWKATEFRTFLLYAGVIVLQNVEGFSSELYSHFLLLHTAISILSSDRHICDPRNIDVAHEMLQLFVTDFDSLYGKEFISYNVHNLLHLCADVKRFGALGNFSAFKFENYMGTVKRMIRKGDKPLQQLARRYAEVENIQKLKNYATEEFILDHAHNRGPLTQDCLTNIPKQYKNLKTKGFSINCDDIRNNCVMLKDGTFLIVENILQLGGQDIKIVGHRLCFKGSLYEDPDSRLINIYMANNVNEEEKHCLLLSDVISKAWKIPTSKGIAVIPLLHKAERK